MTGWILMAGLALLAGALGGPVPRRLAAARWPFRCPRAALVLWQAVGLAGGLAAVGAGLLAAVAPLAAAFPHGFHVAAGQLVTGQSPRGFGIGGVLALTWAVGLAGWLFAYTIRVLAGAVRGRRRQRLLLDLTGRRVPNLDNAYVLPHPASAAYCLPGLPSRVVISGGTLRLLTRSELRAVLAHERAHARERHDLVLLPFTVLVHALPWLPAAHTAHRTVAGLIEMLADDQAGRVHGGRVLARALVTLATHHSGTSPAGVLAATETATYTRLERLLSPGPPPPAWLPALTYIAAAALTAVPTGVLLAPLAAGIH